MSGVLLDTHILVWWRTQPARLSTDQARLLLELEARGEPVGISAISLWELAKMVQKGRLEVRQPPEGWLAGIEEHPLITIYPLTARISAESVSLGTEFHLDPADQIIVATARCHGLRLLTADERIRGWGKVLLV